MAKTLTHHWRGILMALFGLAIALVPAPTSTKAGMDRTIRLEASTYQFSPAVMKVNPGDRVTLELASLDVVHGVYIDGYDLEFDADPGQVRDLTFIADREGTFRLRCSVPCGALHPFMIGKLQVGQNWLLWRAITLALLIALASLWLNREPAAK